MPAPAIAPILERFAQRTTSDRAALLQFAREAPPVYGPWQLFKKLYKLAEAPALEDGETDAESLGALLARIDAAPIPDKNQPRLKKLENTPKIPKPETARIGERKFSVGGRNYDWDSNGWRLKTEGATGAEKTGGVFAAIKAALAPGSSAKEKCDCAALDGKWLAAAVRAGPGVLRKRAAQFRR